ncbi:MAG: hypothetical protein Kow00114_16980 [Kiloniellaceae bacterium]
MHTVVDYLDGVKAGEAARGAAGGRPPAGASDDRDLSGWLDLMVLVCPGPIARACGPDLVKSLGRERLGDLEDGI